MAPLVADGPSLYPERSFPLRLADGDFFSGMYENQPANHVSVYRLAAHANGEYITAEIFFGAPDPGMALMRVAEAQLSRLEVTAPGGG
jgi:hypothetical protein